MREHADVMTSVICDFVPVFADDFYLVGHRFFRCAIDYRFHILYIGCLPLLCGASCQVSVS